MCMLCLCSSTRLGIASATMQRPRTRSARPATMPKGPAGPTRRATALPMSIPAGVERSRPTFGDIDTARWGVAGVDLAGFEQPCFGGSGCGPGGFAGPCRGGVSGCVGRADVALRRSVRCVAAARVHPHELRPGTNRVPPRREPRRARPVYDARCAHGRRDPCVACEGDRTRGAQEASPQRRRLLGAVPRLSLRHGGPEIRWRTRAWRCTPISKPRPPLRGWAPSTRSWRCSALSARGSMRMGDDGMWHLHAKLDFIAGREVSAAIQAAVRSQRHRNNDNNFTNTNTNTNNGERRAATATTTAAATAAATAVATSRREPSSPPTRSATSSPAPPRRGEQPPTC